MFPRKYNKQNRLKRFILKLLNVYAYERETLNIVNPNYENNFGNLAKFNDKSFNFSRGYLDLSRKIKKLDIFFRYAPNSSLYNSKGNWKRVIPGISKEQLISTCLMSLKYSILSFLDSNKLEISLHLISDNSNDKFDEKLLNLISNKKFKISIQKSKVAGNRGSYLECCDQAELAEDLIFFIEDDYLFEKHCLDEMLFTFSRLSTILKEDVIACPTDYSFFYDSFYKTSLFIGKNYRWRIVGETLLTFMLSKNVFQQNKKIIRKVGEKINEPFEKPLHELYKSNLCIAPVNTLAYHISRGVPSVNEDWISTWNENYKKI
tara:strand:+ start:7760 stop:8716 length:957 start_codon:yes stop_codon:yes gene_type:complete